MGSIMLKGITALIAAYTFIKWFPLPTPFSVENFLVECILNPLGFLAAMFSFLIGFLCLGSLIHQSIFQIKRKQKNYREFFSLLLWILSILLLTQSGVWHVIFLYVFGIFYGMMALKEKTVNGG